MKGIVRSISLILCTAVIVCLFTFRTNAATSGYYTYTVSAGKAKITAVDKSISGNIEIPSELDSYTVNSIGSSAFASCNKIESVVVPDTVTSIEYRAFYKCSALNSISIGENVLAVGCHAFEKTAFYVNKSNWEDGALYIGNVLIKAEDNIGPSYSIKEGTIVIADQAFLNCNLLTQVYLPGNTFKIGDLSFYFCNSLTDVYYGGDDSTLKRLSIGENNSVFINSVWHYGGYIYLNKSTAGDINGDSCVDNKDLVCLFKYQTGWAVETVKRVLDVNGDTMYNNRDLVRLMRYLSGWDVKIYPLEDDNVPSIGGDQGTIV